MLTHWNPAPLGIPYTNSSGSGRHQISRLAISTCTTQYRRYIPVRQVTGTRTTRYWTRYTLCIPPGTDWTDASKPGINIIGKCYSLGLSGDVFSHQYHLLFYINLKLAKSTSLNDKEDLRIMLSGPMVHLIYMVLSVL
ncbi:hypothetical protein BHE74_00038945 [Ensete ventricosum]|nr:hypothetical protein BHE74_00038945 [Ensete ventricosum]